MTATKLERMLFGFDAANSTTRRRAPVVQLQGTDDVLPTFGRDHVDSSTRDLERNYSVAAGAIRKHLDFVSDFSFQANTPNIEFNKTLQKFVTTWSKRRNCHIAKRFSLPSLVRMIEHHRTVDGDCLIELVKGARINLIRGDRIRDRHGFSNTDRRKNGIHVNAQQQVIGYDVHTRTTSGGFVYEKTIPAANAIHHGYFESTEQFRGVSPLTSAVNTFRDCYEGVDYALARLKAEMLIGFAVESDQTSGLNPYGGNQQFQDFDRSEMTEEEIRIYEQELADRESKSGKVDFGSGPFWMHLDKGESIKSVSGNMPSSNAQNFIDVCVMMALKALDIPMSFYREDFTNFAGQRSAFQLYKRSAAIKQRGNAEILDEVTLWLMTWGIVTNQVSLPRGWTLADLEHWWEWVPRGVPWWDRSREVRGDLLAISSGLDTPQNVCRENGTVFEDNVDALNDAAGYWNSKPNLKDHPVAFLGLPGMQDSKNAKRRKPENQ